MKKKLGLLCSVLALSTASTAMAGLSDLCLQPYAGVDVSIRHLGFHDTAEKIFKRTYPQGDVYLGVKFNDYLGVQAGYEAIASRHKTTNFIGSDIFFGNTLNPDVPNGLNQIVSSVRQYGWHADLVGFLPFCEEYCLSLIGSVGIAQLRTKLSFTSPIVDNAVATATELALSNRTFTGRKYVARLGLGIQQMLSDCLGVRFMFTWENTSRFKKLIAPEQPTTAAIVNLRNSTTFGVGVFYNF